MNRIEVFCFKNNCYMHFDIANLVSNMHSVYRDDILTTYGIKLKKNLNYDVVVIHNEFTNTIIKITDENTITKIGGVSNVQR